jgi:hypothetical protein
LLSRTAKKQAPPFLLGRAGLVPLRQSERLADLLPVLFFWWYPSSQMANANEHISPSGNVKPTEANQD